MGRKLVLKKLLIVFLIVSMLMNTSTTVLATTVEAIEDAIETNEDSEIETVEINNEEIQENDSESEEEIISEELTENNEEIIESENEEIELEEETKVESTNVEENNSEEFKRISAKYTSSNGSVYDVFLTYNRSANLPEGAILSVTEFDESTAEYNSAFEAVSADKEKRGDKEEFNMVALDISILDANGNEVEPEAPVSVEMKIKSLPGVEDLNNVVDSLEIQHHVENKGKTSIDNVVESKDELNVVKDMINTEFEVESFSTFTITWTSGGWFGPTTTTTTTIHYGYLNGDTFVEFAEEEGKFDGTNQNRKYLIYDFDGYLYSGNTYYRTNASEQPVSGGTKISPLLGRESFYYTNGSTGSIANGSHIYVIYNQKEATPEGGSASPSQNQDEPVAPEVEKASKDNKDGTRTISLSITGHTKDLKTEKLADVIVVFDVSGSMSENMSGSSRLQVAKNAVNKMAEELLSKNTKETPELIRMSLISFSTDASVALDFTGNVNDYKAAVNGLRADGGTNWEKALRLADEMAVESDRKTFVVFVSDGDPTFRESRMEKNDSNLDVYSDGTYRYYRENSVFGAGSSDQYGRNYNAALAQAKSIVDNKKTLFTIALGGSNAVSKMETLQTQSGGKAEQNFNATNATALTNALNTITEQIKGTVGWSAVIDDGITGLTNLTAKTPVVGVDTDSFTYTFTKNDKPYELQLPEGTTLSEATYDEESGSVVWNLSEGYQLEDGVTYTVSFIVWPSQEAIDYVTNLNNEEISYENLPEGVKTQIEESPAGSGKYVLKTNTEDAHVSYYSSTKIGDDVTVDETEHIEKFNSVDPLNLDTMILNVKKIFTDSLTGGEDRNKMSTVTLLLKRRTVSLNEDQTESYGEWEDVAVPYINPDGERVVSNEIVLSNKNNWNAEFYVSPGLIASGKTYNAGYEFMLEEPAIDYHYELNSEIIKPMLVNTVKTYIGDNDGNNSLTAGNIVKGGINVKKVLHDQYGNVTTDDATEFTFRGYILDAEGNPYTFNNSWDNRADKNSSEGASSEWLAHQNDTGAYHVFDANENRIAYKLHFDSTAQIEFKLKAGESVRFINVPQGSTYEFYEVTEGLKPEYSIKNVEGKNQSKDENGNYSSTYVDEEGNTIKVPQPTVKNNTVSGTVYGNVQHNVTVTNIRKSIDVTFAGTKKIENRKMTEADIFTFEVKEGDKIIQTVTNDATGKINFEAIRYTEAGTHNYIVKETSKDANGITVDTRSYEVTVTITENENGVLEATVSDNAQKLDFINIYGATGSAQFAGNKTVIGRDMKSTDIFRFKISEGESTWYAENDSTGKINFPEISYTLADVGKHTYKVEEEKSQIGGIQENKSYYTVTVDVSDNGDGTLTVKLSDNAASLNFVNEYKPENVTVQFSGNKILNGKTLLDKEFKFYLKDAEGNVIQTKSNNAKGEIVFDEITYTTPGEYNYTINEEKSTNAGVTIDSKVYEVKVTVVDDLEGHLIATISGLNSDGTGANFENSYAATGTLTLKGTKTLIGRQMKATDIFEFEVKEDDKVVATGSNNGTGTITFTEITYTLQDVGTHTYVVTEKETTIAGVQKNETSYTVTVIVTDNGDGSLKVDASKNASTLDFVNIYKTENTSVKFSGTKTLTGKALLNNEFQFELKDAEGNVIQTKSNNANGEIVFDEITYTTPGEYKYTINEEKSTNTGVTIDSKVYEVKVTVVDDLEGHLVATISGLNSDGTGADFVNEYKAANTTVQFSGIKTLTGKALLNNEFQFELKDAEENVIQTKSNNTKGEIVFDKIIYTTPGEYKYTISEKTSTNAGVTIDEHVYEVTVSVIDDFEGHLIATISGLNPDGTGANFANSYAATGVLKLAGTKTLTGRNMKATDNFEFEVKENGKVVVTGSNNGTETITFDEIAYTLQDVGTHTYVVTEKETAIAGVQKNETSYTVTVTVTDNGDGSLKVDASKNATALDFENIYKATGKTNFAVTKVLEGKDLEENQFSFVLVDNEKEEEIETVQNDAEGNVTFGEINYTEKDSGKTYTYTITEKDDNEDGYVYDDMEVIVTVTITDNGDGTLAVDVKYSDDTEFNNKYETVEVSVTKDWDDSNNQDGIRPDSVQVVLKANGEDVETVTLSDENDWSHTWSDLVKHSEKVDIKYTVEELETEGYNPEITTTLDENGNVTVNILNVHKAETTEVTTVKVWDDYDNIDGIRPDSIKVQLYAGEEKVGEEITLNEENKWSYTWTELDKNADGKEIKYSVKEVEIPELYEVSYTTRKDGILEIKNTQILGEGGSEEEIEIPEEPYTGENPSTGLSLFDNFALYIALIIAAIVVAVVETKKVIIK